MIEFRDVAVCYAPLDRYPVNALEDIDLKIADGEWVFLVGPSGAGKSTLLKLIYGDARAERGQVLVDGRDVTKLPPHQIPILRRGIGVIFQDFQLLPQKTVWENVAFALQVIGAPQKRLVRDVPRALDTVGLGHKADSRPNQLSGGERQRVSIARAIVNSPRLLLADEPTGNLDPQTGQDIIDVLQRINESGTLVVMATHDRAVVDRMQRRVVRLAEGRVFSDEARGVYHPEDEVLQQPATTSTPPTSLVIAPPPIAPTMPDAMPPTIEPASQDAAPTPPAPPAGRRDPYRDVMPPDELAPLAQNDHHRNGATQPSAPSNNGDHHAPAPHATRPYAAPWLDEPNPQRLRDASPRDASPRDASRDARVRDAAPSSKAPGEGERDSPFETPRRNDAPLGSPENPLVQFEPPPSRPRREP